jgi:PAS domain S-box-containing protein
MVFSMDRQVETTFGELAGQLRQRLARLLVDSENDGQSNEHTRAELRKGIEDLARLASTAELRADVAMRERDALDEAMHELEDRLGSEIVAHQATTRELEQQRSALRHVVESLPYCIFWRDRNGRYLGANRNKLKALGLASLDQLVGKTAYETGVSREEADFYRKVDEQVMSTGQPIFNLEEIQQRPDGPHVLLISKVPLRDDSGAVVGILGMYIDVTERHRLELQPPRLEGGGEPARHGRA